MNAKYLLIAALGIVAASPAHAVDYTLTFDRNQACGNTVCGNNSIISQGYGDTAEIDLSYRSPTGVGDTASLRNDIRYYSSAYGDLTDIAYGGDSAAGIGEITFTPAAGYSVTLNSVDFAGWPNANITSALRVYDLAYNLLFNSGSITFPGAGHGTQVFPTLTSVSGLRLQWGADGYNGGIDNVSFSVNELAAAVPEPATWAMMIGGFGLVGGAMRRRTRRGAALRTA